MQSVATIPAIRHMTGPWPVRWATRAKAEPLAAVAVLCLTIGFVVRMVRGLSAPLEFDETFTMVIASQRTFAGFGEWVFNELGGPLYYGIAYVWHHVVGDNDRLMRLPSMLFSMAVPLLILRSRTIDLPTRLIWAALIALWPLGIAIGSIARSYALLSLLSTAQALAFIALLRAPERKAATIWVGISALAVITHYHAGIISFAQGVILLAYRPKAALRCWPAALLLLPVVFWAAAQFNFLMMYAKPGANWYQLIPAAALWKVAAMAIGCGTFSLVLGLEGTMAFIGRLRRHEANAPGIDWPVALTVLSAIGAIAIVAGMGMVVPSFTPRYFVPYTPVVLLGIACSIASIGRRYTWLSPAGALAGLCVMLGYMGLSEATGRPAPERTFSMQPVSEWIIAEGPPRKMVLLWDNPTADIDAAPDHLGQFGGYIIRRTGAPLDMVIPHGIPTNADPNVVLPMLARKYHAGFLWVYDLTVPGTRGTSHPFSGAPRGFRCATFGNRVSTFVGCLPQSRT